MVANQIILRIGDLSENLNIYTEGLEASVMPDEFETAIDELEAEVTEDEFETDVEVEYGNN